MTDEPHQPEAWNAEARISCEFAFKCPKTWERLSPTDSATIRHCSECDRDVHLALTEDDFRQHAGAKWCTAVRVLQPGQSAEDANEAYVIGNAEPSPYNFYLRRV